MAVNKMLIDASHPEETRVAVVRGNRVEEFDFESQAKRQLRGNIYLAKVTRVEPSLQAAFVEYGGNRHGFLAFSEIHPDYYQIPFADRQALLAQDEEEDEEAPEPETRGRGRRRDGKRRRRGGRGDFAAAGETDGESSANSEAGAQEHAAPQTDWREGADEEADSHPGQSGDARDADDSRSKDDENSGGGPMAAAHETDSISEPAADDGDGDGGGDSDGASDKADAPARGRPRRRRTRRAGSPAVAAAEEVAEAGEPAQTAETAGEPVAMSEDAERAQPGQAGEEGNQPLPADEPNGDGGEEEHVESVGQEDAMEEVPERRRPRRAYKIQEVIKRRQIMLVQVVKEERGNKGAALTTYLSLAGRYCVLMPNSGRGGGISRKITSAADRKRLKEIAGDLEVPQGMGVILRTAGAARTKPEIRRDFEYLMRLWENVRNLTLTSNAPCLVYEEGSLIKRSIRDLYDKDTGEIIVQGEAGYREAKEFMRMLMPSHARHVQPYLEDQSLFSRHGVEAQLDRLLTPQVTLKSGGYVVINQTEALVSIDVNSGKSTREHSIEDTALQTNLEAADEIARQLRLRDLAGLIVIDFIDMEENRNNRAVEKRLKEALRDDRARIQVGRISHFGLMEMSRQRIRVSVMESTMDVCPHCGGLGHVRSQSSLALHIFRAVEEHLSRHSRNDLSVRCPVRVALEVLNTKRAGLADLELRHGVRISVVADETLPGQAFQIVKGEPATGTPVARQPVRIADELEPEAEALPAEELVADAAEAEPVSRGEEGSGRQFESNGGRGEEADGERGGRRRRRRRGRRGAGNFADGDRARGEPRDGGDETRASDDSALAGQSDAGETVSPAAEATQEANASPEEAPREQGGRRGKRGGRGSRRPDRESRPSAGDVRFGAEPPMAADQPRRGDTSGVAADAEPTRQDAAPHPEAAQDLAELPSAPARKRRPTRRVTSASENAAVSATVSEAPAAEAAGKESKEEESRKGGWWRRAGGFF
jgi:ribonuclease E